MNAILLNPEDDSARIALAEVLSENDPAWSKVIKTQLEYAKQRRLGGMPDTPMERDQRLLDENKSRWTRPLDMYLGETWRQRVVEIDRGLPRLCSMNPYLFLEQGADVMARIAPLRGIWFFDDPEGDPFPMKELAASPLLERLDEIRFRDCTLSEDDLLTFAASEHLHRVQSVSLLGIRHLSPAVLEAFAANPQLRKMLMIDHEIVAPDGPIGEFWQRNDWGDYLVDAGAVGDAMEARHGYIPWLHVANSASIEDANYFVEHKRLPRFVPGSPTDAPTPYGDCFGRVPRTPESRDKWWNWEMIPPDHFTRGRS